MSLSQLQSLGNTPKFDDPFMLPSNSTFPTELGAALDFCRYVYGLNPVYVATTNRVFAYFMTELVFQGRDVGDSEQRKVLKDTLMHDINIMGILQQDGIEWACFSGDTPVQTEEGVFNIRDLEGRTVNALGQDGVFREAEFKCFGEQNLYEVEFSDGTKVKATANHEWIVKNCSGKLTRTTTDKLNLKYKVPRAAAASRPEKNADYTVGVRHGFIYGDGTTVNQSKNTQQSRAQFFGDKDKALYPFFEDHHNPIRERTDKPYEMHYQSGHPPEFKQLPSPTESRSYWYGFVCGFLAADGAVDNRDGSVVLCQCNPAVLHAIQAQAPRIGMHAGSMWGPILRGPRIIDGREVGESTMHHLHLLRNFMEEGDFIIHEHRNRFIKHSKENASYGKFIGIAAVRNLNVTEPVYCGTEMETHTLSVGSGVVTGNCYGNSFQVMNRPFDRYLAFPVGDNGKVSHIAISTIPQQYVSFNINTLTYKVPQVVGSKMPKGTPIEKLPLINVAFADKPSTDISRLTFTNLDARFVTLDKSHFSTKTSVTYSFPGEVRARVKAGNLMEVNNMSINMLKAIKQDGNYRYHDDEVYHFKNPTVSGLSNAGWGIPSTILHYRNIHQLQVYRKIDESIGLDYLTPFRVFTPELSTSTGDATLRLLMSPWKSEITKMVAKRRVDKFAMHALPYPVKYEEFGADGKSYAPHELIEYANQQLMDGLGYPQELLRGSLAVQQMPTAMRLFESSYQWMYHGLNQKVRWVARKVQEFLNQDVLEVDLSKPSQADNLEAQSVWMQLASGGEIPRRVAYKKFGITDAVAAAKERMEEDIEIQEAQEELGRAAERKKTEGSMAETVAAAQQEQQMAAAQQPQGAPPQGGGAPPQGGGGQAQGQLDYAPNGAENPLQIQQRAEDIAKQWLTMEEGPRRAEMRNAQAVNPTIHAAAKQKMEEMRSSAASQGRAGVADMIQGG